MNTMFNLDGLLNTYFRSVLTCFPALAYWTNNGANRQDSSVDHFSMFLLENITTALSFLNKPHDDVDLKRLSQKTVNEALQSLPIIKEFLEKDVQLAFDNDPSAISTKEIETTYPFIYAISIHRLAHVLHKLKVPILPRVLSEEAHSKTAIDIHPGATISSPFFIDHGTGVVIGETVEIGKNVQMYHGVTLGSLSFKRDKEGNIIRGKKRHPTIKDNVILYSGCVVLGGDTVIGENSVIGANVWVINSVPANTAVTFEEHSMNRKAR